MQIAIHIGAHCTETERLMKSLLKNADAFAQQGIKVPGPGKYRVLLREMVQNLAGQAPTPETREILLDAILDEDHADRLVLSHPNILCVVNRIFEGQEVYAQTPVKISTFRSLFAQDEMEFFLTLRNPATFIPAAFAEARHPQIDQFLHGMDPREMRWSEVVAKIRAAAPDVPLTVWCNEDAPLLWSQLVREVSGVDPLTPIVGGFDLLSAIMQPEGMKRFLSYLKTHPPQTEGQKRRIIAAFLDKYAKPEEVEEELDLPGWTVELVDEMTRAYEDDVEDIARMPGVTLLTP